MFRNFAFAAIVAFNTSAQAQPIMELPKANVFAGEGVVVEDPIIDPYTGKPVPGDLYDHFCNDGTPNSPDRMAVSLSAPVYTGMEKVDGELRAGFLVCNDFVNWTVPLKRLCRELDNAIDLSSRHLKENPKEIVGYGYAEQEIPRWISGMIKNQSHLLMVHERYCSRAIS
jgi:hypothetical protein